MKHLTLGFSPCPNDTFIFDALVHQKIDTEGLHFDVVLGDVEELNEKAFRNELDITKLSYHAMAFCLDNYQLLNAGSALGSGVGPLLIAKKELSEIEIDQARIAIPGKYTTANFLLSLAYPNANKKQEILFSEIEDAVLNDQFDAGLIIHENRFTYAERGLVKLMDLGAYWESVSNHLIPLGGIVVRRGFDAALKAKIDRVLKKSIEFAFKDRTSSKDYVIQHAQEMEEEVINQHIDLYVNQYTLDLGREGKNAINHLFDEAVQKKIVKEIIKPIFV